MLFTPRAPAFHRSPSVASAVPFLPETAPSPATRRRDRAFRHGLLAADVLAAVLVALLVTSWIDGGHLTTAILVLPLLVIVVHAANRMYERDEKLINKSTLDEAPAIFQAATLVAMLAMLFDRVLLDTAVNPVVVVATWIGLAMTVTTCRVAARAAVRDLMPSERCLIVGDHVHGRRLAQRLSEEPKVKVELAGVLDLPDEIGTAETHQRLAAVVSARDVHRVVIVADAGAPQQELQTIQAAKALGVKVSVMPRVLEVLGSSATYDYIDGLTLLGLPRFGLSRASRHTKRSFDVLGSLVLLIAFLPVLGVIAATVKLTSPGAVLFRQTRIGRGGEPFFMLKFRSMHDDADRLKDTLRSRNEADGLFKIADDPRITTVGRFLRRSSLDELPQLWNVLRGEMSLVGPRPLVPEEDGMIRGWHRRRLQLTPGMTGPWQVLGSARIPLREMVTIDYQYVGNWSLWGDIKIMLRTLGVMLARGGR
jgi:exopolysaccharide biosynthesis polyprenyl glycosylphosphotransferase